MPVPSDPIGRFPWDSHRNDTPMDKPRVVHGTYLSVPFPSHGTFPMGFPFPWTSLVIQGRETKVLWFTACASGVDTMSTCAAYWGLQTFLSEGHIKLQHNSSRAGHLTKCDLFWDMLHSTRSTNFSEIAYINFSLLTNAFAGQMEWLRGPDLARAP